MGSSQSRTASVSTDRYVCEVRRVTNGMSARDKRLYNYARLRIAEENLDDVEVTVGFDDQDAVVLQGSSNPSGMVYIGLDYYDKPQLVWTKQGFWRAAKRFFVGCYSTLKTALLDTLAIGAGVARRAITYF